MKANIHLRSYLAQLFLEQEMFLKEMYIGNQNARCVFSNILSEVLPSMRNVENYCRARQTTDENTPHAHCMLNTKVYKHTLSICNACCFSIAIMIEKNRLNLRYSYIKFLIYL
jgi:hypothetical protein